MEEIAQLEELVAELRSAKRSDVLDMAKNAAVGTVKRAQGARSRRKAVNRGWRDETQACVEKGGRFESKYVASREAGARGEDKGCEDIFGAVAPSD